MFRICSEFSAIFRICSEFSAMFRICSEFWVIFRICSEFSESVQNLFRIFSNVQNLFRIFSEFWVIFRHFSEFLAQKLVYSESLDFVVLGPVSSVNRQVKSTVDWGLLQVLTRQHLLFTCLLTLHLVIFVILMYVIWSIEFYFSDVGLSTRKQTIGDEILQILS
jgi:hypothetical protein